MIKTKDSLASKLLIVSTVLGLTIFIGIYLVILLGFDSKKRECVSDNSTHEEAFGDSSDIEEVYTDKLIGRQYPHPFLNNFRGPPPASFSPTSDKNFAQLQGYSAPHYPRNIQEIINYITPEKPKPKRPQFHHDPFYPYKPKDPSDINLLATANLRFAPPIWKDIKTNPLMPSPTLYKPNYELPKPKKPIELTLNIFPMPNDEDGHFFGFASQNRAKFAHVIENESTKRQMRPRKMVIHLNVYTEESEEEIQRKIRIGNWEGLQDILMPPPPKQ
ncbi:PREDICTED: uncharacterized protein LOC108566419 [Nicrophorus vespilloides]|uniref:Uncharacterized protein LOC108566419 n=1 Tax=Nicrophorus vespilloides TaxID=110193 RepID=A0ABM1N4L7_NICVS|nr:PREDICTED: uncharacterized protein LOC108566419 [Nicrophorus vespilloides]